MIDRSIGEMFLRSPPCKTLRVRLASRLSFYFLDLAAEALVVSTSAEALVQMQALPAFNNPETNDDAEKKVCVSLARA
jgi:hypothetical protein